MFDFAALSQFSNRSKERIVTLARLLDSRCPRQFVRRRKLEEEPDGGTRASTKFRLAAADFFHEYLKRHFQAIADRTEFLEGAGILDGDVLFAAFKSEYFLPGSSRKILDYDDSNARTLFNNVAQHFAKYSLALTGHKIVRLGSSFELQSGELAFRGNFDLGTKDGRGHVHLWTWRTGRIPTKRFANQDARYVDFALEATAVWAREQYKVDQCWAHAFYLGVSPGCIEQESNKLNAGDVYDNLPKFQQRLNEMSEASTSPSKLCDYCEFLRTCPEGGTFQVSPRERPRPTYQNDMDDDF
jgi:hypothetical protein